MAASHTQYKRPKCTTCIDYCDIKSDSEEACVMPDSEEEHKHENFEPQVEFESDTDNEWKVAEHRKRKRKRKLSWGPTDLRDSEEKSVKHLKVRDFTKVVIFRPFGIESKEKFLRYCRNNGVAMRGFYLKAV